MVMDVSRMQTCHGHSETHSPTHAHTHTISSIIMIEHVSSPPRRWGQQMFCMPLAGACSAHAGKHNYSACLLLRHAASFRPRGHTHMFCMPLAEACSAHAGKRICQDLQPQGAIFHSLAGTLTLLSIATFDAPNFPSPHLRFSLTQPCQHAATPCRSWIAPHSRGKCRLV